jgi:hypothetical protein
MGLLSSAQFITTTRCYVVHNNKGELECSWQAHLFQSLLLCNLFTTFQERTKECEMRTQASFLEASVCTLFVCLRATIWPIM